MDQGMYLASSARKWEGNFPELKMSTLCKICGLFVVGWLLLFTVYCGFFCGGFFSSFEHTHTHREMLLYTKPAFIQQWCFDHSSCCSICLWKMHCKHLSFFVVVVVFYLLPTCVGSHSPGEEKILQLRFCFAFLSLLLFWVSLQTVLKLMLRLSSVEVGMQGHACLLFYSAQAEALLNLEVLSCSSVGWEGS